MKLLAVTAVTIAASAFARSAAACGVPDFGAMLAEAFQSETTQVHTPIVIVGGGSSTEGRVGSFAVGYAWGEKQNDWLFPGSSVTRVLLDTRTDAGKTTAVAATYGWYQNKVGSAGLDLGAEAELSGLRGVGPTGRLTLGLHGVALQLTGGVMFGGEAPRYEGSAQLVLEVMDMTGVI